MALFKVTKEDMNGQIVSLNVQSTYNTVEELMKNSRFKLWCLMDCTVHDHLDAELIEDTFDWFERQRIINEQRAMDGDDSILGNPAY